MSQSGKRGRRYTRENRESLYIRHIPRMPDLLFVGTRLPAAHRSQTKCTVTAATLNGPVERKSARGNLDRSDGRRCRADLQEQPKLKRRGGQRWGFINLELGSSAAAASSASPRPERTSYCSLRFVGRGPVRDSALACGQASTYFFLI